MKPQIERRHRERIKKERAKKMAKAVMSGQVKLVEDWPMVANQDLLYNESHDYKDTGNKKNVWMELVEYVVVDVGQNWSFLNTEFSLKACVWLNTCIQFWPGAKRGDIDNSGLRIISTPLRLLKLPSGISQFIHVSTNSGS